MRVPSNGRVFARFQHLKTHVMSFTFGWKRMETTLYGSLFGKDLDKKERVRSAHDKTSQSIERTATVQRLSTANLRS